jgi:hypothetical protein
MMKELYIAYGGVWPNPIVVGPIPYGGGWPNPIVVGPIPYGK